MEKLYGRVWRKTVRKDSVPRYRAEHAVLSTRLFAGETRIHILADAPPEPGFEQVATDLEDVYFSVLRAC
jgi:ABC-2 type transport system ATP-binding protein